MGELARRIGVQVLYVSHHKPALLAPFGRVLHLRCARGQIEVEASDAPADSAFVGWEGEAGVEDWLEGVGLTHIRLRNVRQHASTRLALSPGLNIITGDNDIGKSTIVHALRAARDNAGFAGLIGQQDDSAEVEIGLEEGRTLCYRYRRKGARKSTYTLLEADGSEIAASDSGTAVPAWVSDHLAMPPAPDIDLHIGEQAAPLFMIGAETSTYQRAELLSLGREGDHAARLVRAHTERVRQCRQEVARAERALRGVKLQLATLRGIDERITALRALAERMQASAAARERAAAIRQSGQAIAANAARLGALASLPQGPIAPEAGLDAAARERPGRLYATMARLEVLTARAKAIRALPGPLAERKLDTGRPRAIARLGRDLGRLSARIEALAGVESLTLPAARAARDTALMRSLVERSAAIERQVAESARASEEGARRLAAIDDERAALMTEAGGHCPLCLRPQTDAGHHHHHGGRIA
nr:AAA family ATPase [Natronocella acetinitrilica]